MQKAAPFALLILALPILPASSLYFSEDPGFAASVPTTGEARKE
jgi:hypothetical protein